jgi:hypothetical protein
VYRELFPRGIKRQGREAYHSPSSVAEVKKSGIIPPLPHMSSSGHKLYLLNEKRFLRRKRY